MKILNDIKGYLLSYIAHEQVAFQFGDGLISFTKPKDDYDLFEIELGLPDEVEQMRFYISNAESIKEVKRESLFDNDLGFAEFANWSNDKDTLFLIDDGLLLCISN